MRFTSSLLAALLSLSAAAEIRINEVMASNVRSFPNAMDFEDYPDWIELFNDSDQQQSLNGYYLSDDPNTHDKWAFSPDATIEPFEHLVIVADGYDSPLGSNHSRNYVGGEKFITQFHHTNFKLSSDGEELLLSRDQRERREVVSKNSSWAYFDLAFNWGLVGWQTPEFDDSEWSTGNGVFGHGTLESPTFQTETSFGDNPNEKIRGTYFRQNFNLDELESVRRLALTYLADDGVIFYLNGEEIYQDNFNPTIEINSNLYQTVILPPDHLAEGSNTLAAFVTLSTPTSPTMRFDASMEVELGSTLAVVDHLTFGKQIDDLSYGRPLINPETWIHMARPTPGEVNFSPVVSDIRANSPSPEISPSAGLYETPPTVALDSTEGVIRFTTDGSNPTSNSQRYTGPIELTGTTVVRARTFCSGKVPSPIITQTYFAGETFDNGLPIISVTAPDDTLFDPEFGIYGNRDQRGGNIHKGVDAPGNLEFFPADGSSGFSVNGAFRLGGENNFLSHAQKALNFAMRGRYGDDALNYNLFPGAKTGTFTALTLREGGDDWGKAHLTDAIWNAIVDGRMEVETNRYRPCAMFINGTYWGLYNIRDRWDDNWFFQEYGTDDGEYDHVRFDRNRRSLENGTLDDWDNLYQFITQPNLSGAEAWETIESEIDIDSLIDFTICEIFGGNTSWQGNREAWQDNRSGGKWRWFLPDMDRTLGNSSTRSTAAGFIKDETTVSRLNSFIQFKVRLAQRAAAHRASTLATSRIKNLIETLGAAAAPEIPRQTTRWTAPTEETYASSLERMKSFVDLQDSRFLNDIGANTVNTPLANLTLSTTGEGSFKFAGVKLEAQTFEAFVNASAELEAIPAAGFRFDHWSGANGDAKTSLRFSGDTTVTAHFVPDSSTELGGILLADLTLTQENSPYIITEDLIVQAGSTLTINSGVILEFQSGTNLRVRGTLNVIGTEEAKVQFKGHSDEIWGGVSFEETTTYSTLTHLLVRNASSGKNPVLYPSAISGLNSEVEMNFIDIGESRAPLFFRGGKMVLRDSSIAIPLTGDGLNVKQGRAETTRCTFVGNQSPDTDAIDYDGVINGVIRDCRMYDFKGFNSDGIDIGEQCVNCLIEGNSIFYNSDKGVSVGQGSTIILKNNLIVGCPLGIAVKDAGSSVIVNQNTIVDCGEGVAVYEKNFGDGGGEAVVTNSIFSNCKQAITSDVYSSISATYSLSDTTPLPGVGNLLADPRFQDAGALNFEITLESPALNAGDPQHPNDPDGTRADIGALYLYSPDDYPFDRTPTIVINEILANSGDSPDWIELYNRTNEPVEIGGWFLSDAKSNLKKYRISPDTIIPAGGFLIFSEDLHFGEDSDDPGNLESFALSDTGETVFLTSANEDKLTYYRFEEEFGSSLEGRTLGFHYKPSSDSYNFVPLETSTPGVANSQPMLGPIVISEIMYHSAVEYLELLNVSSNPVPILGWRMGRGIELDITSDRMIAPGERVILTENAARFNELYQPRQGLLVLEWREGKLNNGGETLELQRPGPSNKLNIGTFVRVDRVKYDNNQPWDSGADGTGLSLGKIDEKFYGNDFINWQAGTPSPGLFDTFQTLAEWQSFWNQDQADDNPDGDNLSNIFEYAFDRNPLVSDASDLVTIEKSGDGLAIFYPLGAGRPDLDIRLEHSVDLQEWNTVQTEIVESRNQANVTGFGPGYYRIRILKLP